jgi:hypothetical protein
VLAGATRLLGHARPAEKPLHPEGELVTGRLVRYGAGSSSGAPSGVGWLDEPGDDEALVRTSRAVGLPPSLPDVHGLAVRLPVGAGDHADLLFATTAWSRVGRHVLVPTMSVGPTLSTLLPYRTAVGPIVFGARHVDTSYQLYWARVGRPWQVLGELRLEEPTEPDAVVSFDPVLHHPPGITPYSWVTRLRERSYAAARAQRDEVRSAADG